MWGAKAILGLGMSPSLSSRQIIRHRLPQAHPLTELGKYAMLGGHMYVEVNVVIYLTKDLLQPTGRKRVLLFG